MHLVWALCRAGQIAAILLRQTMREYCMERVHRAEATDEARRAWGSQVGTPGVDADTDVLLLMVTVGDGWVLGEKVMVLWAPPLQ